MTLTPIAQLAQARRILDAAYDALNEKEAPVLAQLTEARAEVERAKLEVAAWTDAVRDGAMSAYVADGTKSGDGTTIKLYTTLDYAHAEALEWAKGAGMCLTLDVKTFEKVAKATPLAFVTRVEEPRVTIASDLSAFL